MQEIRSRKFAPIKGRVYKYLKTKGLSLRFFFEKIQVADSSFKGKPALSEFGGEILTRIAINFPELSLRWLLTGEGDMEEYNSPTSISSSVLGNNNIVATGQAHLVARSSGIHSEKREERRRKSPEELSECLLAICNEKDKQIAEKDKQISQLIATIAHLSSPK